MNERIFRKHGHRFRLFQTEQSDVFWYGSVIDEDGETIAFCGGGPHVGIEGAEAACDDWSRRQLVQD